MSIAIIIAGALVAGAVLWNGSRQAPQIAGQQGQQEKVDVSKIEIGNDPVLGRENAPVTMFYWYDYQCPFCQRNEQMVMPQIVKEYVETGKVKIVFKDFTFLGEDSFRLAKYSRAVWEVAPGKFYDWHRTIFDNQGQENTGWATTAKINDLTKTVLGATDAATVAQLVVSKDAVYQKDIEAERINAAAVGVSGTPAAVIGSLYVNGAQPYAQFKSAIESALKDK